MKKNGNTKKKKVVYEENPWDDDPPGEMVPVEDFLPPPHVMKKAKMRIIRSRKEVGLPLEENKKLKEQAAKIGISPEALMSAVFIDYLRGKLVRVDK